MFRRALKRTHDGDQQVGKDVNTISTRKTEGSHHTLGDKNVRDEAEKVLEQLVIGADEDLLEKLEQSTNKSRKRRKERKVKPKPVWDDEDDDTLNVRISNKQTETEVTGKEYQTNLKSKFEKVSGSASWAKLKWEKSDSEKEDSDTDELLQRTGDYLTGSESLPQGAIQLKQCTDANKEGQGQGKLKCVEFHPTAQVVLTAGMNQTLSLYQVDGKQNPKIQSTFIERFPIFTAHFTRDGREVIMGSKHKNFYYYDMIAGKMVNVPHMKGLDEENMSRFEMSPDGKFIAFLGKYGHIHMVSSESKEWISSLKMNGRIQDIAFSPDGSKLYSTGDDGEVYIWDVQSRQCVHRFYDDGCIHGTALAVSKNNRYLAAGSYSGVVNIYDTSSCELSRTPKPLKAVMNLTTPCTKLMFNSTSEILAMASNFAERGVKLLHFPSLTVFSNFPDKTDNLRIPLSMDFSLNSGYFTIGNHKGQALLYRVKHYGNY